MREILFIGGSRHGHRMPALLNHAPLGQLLFGEELYRAANETGYSFHPDEAARKTWIMWHTLIQITEINRVIQYTDSLTNGARERQLEHNLEAMRQEAEELRKLQAPYVYSGIRMIKYWNQTKRITRLQWSWLAFDPAVELEELAP